METIRPADRVAVEDVDAKAKKPDVLELLDQARSVVESSRKLPVSSRALVDRESLLKLLDEIRLALPSDVKMASQIMHRREHIINQALAEARRILAANAEDMEAKAQQHSLVALAEKRAEDILKQAENQVRLMMVDAEKQETIPNVDTSDMLARTMQRLGDIFRLIFRRNK